MINEKNKTINYELEKRETWLALIIIFILFNVYKFFSIKYSVADENVYFYMGKLLSEGILPYRDFFFVHTPLRLLPIAAVFKFFGFNFFLLKLIPIIVANISGGLVFLIARKHFGNLRGVFACLLFLFSYSGLFISSYLSGVEGTVMFILACLYFYYEKRPIWSGIFAGLAMMTAIYAIGALAVLGLYMLVKDRQAIWRFISGFCIVVVPVVIVCVGFSGMDFIRDTVLYYFLKTDIGLTSKTLTLWNMALTNALLLIAGLLYVFSKNRQGGLSLLIALVYILAFTIYSDIHVYYFFLVAPFLAIVGSYGLLYFFEKLKFSQLGFGLLVLLVIVPFLVFIAYYSKQSLDLNSIPQAEAMVKEIGQKKSFQTLFGQADVASLLALVSGAKLLNNQVDTNSFGYQLGLVDTGPIIDSIKKGELDILISKQTMIDDKTSYYYGAMANTDLRNAVKESCFNIYTYKSLSFPNDIITVMDCSIKNNR